MRCIDADELLNQYPDDKQAEYLYMPLYEVKNDIRRAPTIYPERHAHWTEKYDGYMIL